MPVISTNIAANSSVRYLNINSAEQSSSLSKLASGSRISQASDDAAGLAISTRISSDVTSLTQAATNASHGISVLQTADGGASNISDILQRMKALASQSASGTVTDNERVYIDAEFQQLTDEVDAIAVGTRYNGQSLLDGTSAFAAGINVMVGSDAADTIEVSLDKLTSQGLGLETTDGVADVGTKANADTQTTATLTIAAGTTLASGTVMDIKINGIDLSITGTAATATAVTGIDAIKTLIDAKLTAATGEDFALTQTAANAALVFTSSTPNAGGSLKLTNGANVALTTTQATTLGFDAASDAGTGGTNGTKANLYLDATMTVASGATVEFKINDVDIKLVGTAATATAGAGAMDAIATQIATQLASATGEDFAVTHTAGANDIVITSQAEGGQLTVTNSTGGALTTTELTALKMTNNATYAVADLTGVAAGTYGTVKSSPAMLTGASSATITEDKVTFEVNNVNVTLTNTGGTNGDGKYSAQDLADTINKALTGSGVTDVKASVRAGELAIATTTTGVDAKLSIDNFSSGTANSILGITTAAAGATPAEGEGAALTAGVQSVSTQAGALTAIAAIDDAINVVSKARANIGALESRFDFHSASIATSIENLEAANSAITDTDVAAESAKLASSKVKTQAAVAAAAQASQMPQDLLKLLQ